MEYSTLFHLGTIFTGWFVTFFGIVLCVRIGWFLHYYLSIRKMKAMPSHRMVTSFVTLPSSVKNFVAGSGFDGTDVNAVVLKTNAKVSTKGNPDIWRTFRLRQVFRVDTASFVWYSKFHVSKWVIVHGVRECYQALGQYRLAFWGIFPARVSKSVETSTNAGLAFLTSAVWYPHALLAKNLQWKTKDNGEVVCTMLRGVQEPISVYIQFDSEHKIRAMRCKRYRGIRKVWWKIEFDDYRNTGKYLVPMQYREIWGSVVEHDDDTDEQAFAQCFEYGRFTVTSLQLRGSLP